MSERGNFLPKIRSFLKKICFGNDSDEVASLRKELEILKRDLDPVKIFNSCQQCLDAKSSLPSLPDAMDKDMNSIKQEIEILRNEMQDNIAAIHRLEILTLSARIDLLTEFGKALPPTMPGRTRTSHKSKGFSFGIITNGKRPEKLAKLLDSIRFQKLDLDYYEIMVAGCVSCLNGTDGVRVFPMDDAANQGRLGAMRNVLAQAAQFNKFVCLDDDFLLHPQWAEAVNAVKGDFDVATGIILNPDLSRYCDWVNIIEDYTFLRTYDQTFDKCQYVTGGYGIYKDYIFNEHSWNDNLGFYQGEDVSFSRRLFDAGYQLKFIPEAIVMHDDERYRQKGYGVIRLKPAESRAMDPNLSLKMEKLCPRTLT
ncbi:MAG: glycosyltransferase family 2 protein [Desulfomonilaceae bacterium]